MIKRVAHIAIAVNNLNEAVAAYDKLLGLKPSHLQTVAEQGVKVAFLPVGDVEIELLEPLGPESGVAKFLERKGEGIHHLCFEVPDIEKGLEEVADRGAELIDKHARRGAEGMIGFLHPRSTKGALIELLQKD